MARCGCGSSCSCLITPGFGIQVEGIGTVENPYQISSDAAELLDRIEFVDSSTIDFTQVGVGTLLSPMEVTAVATVALTQLTDVMGTPADNQVPVWEGDHWEFQDQSGSGGGVPPGGLTGQVLTKLSDTSGDADWVAPSGGSGAMEPVYASSRGHVTATSIPNGTWTVIPYDTNQYEDGIPWESTPSPLYRIPVAGYYEINMGGCLASNITGYRAIAIYQNSTPKSAVQVEPNAAGSTSTTTSVTLKCAAGDYITGRIWHSAGAALAMAGSAANNFLTVTKVPALAPGGGGVVVERPAQAYRKHVAATSILNATVTAIPWDTETNADGITWDAANQAFIAPSDGYYDVEVGVQYAANATGNRVVYIQANGATQASVTAPASPGAVTASATVRVLAGQQIRVLTQQTSGASLALSAGSNQNFVSVTKVPAAYAGSAVSTYGEQNYSASRAHGAATSIPSGASTPVPFDTVSVDDGIPWSVDGYVIPVPGYYNIQASITYNSMASPFSTGYRGMIITVNGGSHTASVATPNAAANVVTAVASATIKLNAGDVVRINGIQTSGAALTIYANAAYNRFSIAKVPAPVVNGAAASGVWGIGNLAKTGTDSNFGDLIYIDSRGQLRGQPQALSTSVYPKVNADLPGTYPLGMTIVQMTGAQSTAGGWPEGVSGSVVTFRRSGESDADACASQWYYVTTSANARCYYRSGSGTGVANAWSPWVKVVDNNNPRTLRRKSTSQNLTAANTWYTITFDVDEGNGTGIAYSSGVFTVPEAGTYQINLMTLFGGVAGAAVVRTRIIGPGGMGLGEQAEGVNATNPSLSQSRSVRLAAGDTLYVESQANVTGTNVTGSSVRYTMIDITRISA